jgi:hypothetical protein
MIVAERTHTDAANEIQNMTPLSVDQERTLPSGYFQSKREATSLSNVLKKQSPVA